MEASKRQKEGNGVKEYIIRMLEFANEREISLIYHFVLHLINWKRGEDTPC